MPIITPIDVNRDSALPPKSSTPQPNYYNTQHIINTNDRGAVFGDPGRYLPADVAFLSRYGYGLVTLRTHFAKARNNQVEAHEELIASGVIKADDYYRYLADYLGLCYLTIDEIGVIQPFYSEFITHALRHDPKLMTRDASGNLTLVTAPKREEIERIRHQVANDFEIRHRFAIASPAVLRQAYLDQLYAPISDHASHALLRHLPVFSAFGIAKPVYVALTMVFILVLFTAGLWTLNLTTTILSIVASTLFLATVVIRFAAAISLRSNKRKIPPIEDIAAADLPIYSVLVAVYDEASVLPDLVDALDDLNWPKSKLDIKIVLEANDTATIVAARRATEDRPQFEIVIVPPGEPQTKPRALNFALPLARGALTVIYDAEDRPDAQQLLAAFHRFQSVDPDVACLQAPILIDNKTHTWLSAMFALEYACLFDGLVPALARWKLPVMLGGTSNHFKTRILRAVGAWDPFNVTEDADLGIRLKRFGFRVETIDIPTYEEAPETYDIWLKQRTRWFKGWMQTGLVHMRHPRRTLAQMQMKGFVTYHLMLTTLIVSALGYPLFFLAVMVHLANIVTTQASWFLASLMSFNLLFAFAVYGLLAYRALSYRATGAHGWYALSLPVYWFFLSRAAWRALFQIAHAPYKWEKTPHGIAKRLRVRSARTPVHVN